MIIKGVGGGLLIDRGGGGELKKVHIHPEMKNVNSSVITRTCLHMQQSFDLGSSGPKDFKKSCLGNTPARQHPSFFFGTRYGIHRRLLP
jgi:hypothetical protein